LNQKFDISMAKQPTSVNQILFQRSCIRQLLHKKIQHDAILAVTQQVLPASMGQQCVCCATQGSKLTLFVRTAAWATQIRYYNPAILEHLNRSSHSGFRKIQVRILPTDSMPDAAPRRALRPSTAAINDIQTCAQNCLSGKLQQSLLHLVDTLRQK
jgi:hypothetical protein